MYFILKIDAYLIWQNSVSISKVYILPIGWRLNYECKIFHRYFLSSLFCCWRVFKCNIIFFLSIFVPDPLTIIMAWFLLAKHFDNGFTLEMYCSVSIFFTIRDSVYSNSTSFQIMWCEYQSIKKNPFKTWAISYQVEILHIFLVIECIRI